MSAPIAFQGEMMLANWRESPTGGSVVILQLADPNDLDQFKLMTAKKGNRAGQRLAVVMVEIGEDERPVVEGEKLSVRAAALCRQTAFWRFVERRQGYAQADDAARLQQAADFVRSYCGITSRSALDTDVVAALAYHRLLAQYQQAQAGTP